MELFSNLSGRAVGFRKLYMILNELFIDRKEQITFSIDKFMKSFLFSFLINGFQVALINYY